jgi:nanoRNase/pAp phosphatase (c-di-AMP/oligoRNAs hydrolase)
VKGIPLENDNPIDDRTLRRLQAAAGEGPVLILTHDNPDPDGLASGMALAVFLKRMWGINSRLVYSGVVARAENRAMLELLTPDWDHADQLSDLEQYSTVALVDTQPGAGNNRLPQDQLPGIVIDHHLPLREQNPAVSYYDLRPAVGSTVSMIYQYYITADLSPDSNLATAMFYGLHTDTNGLARRASMADETAYFGLLQQIDRGKLSQIQQAGQSRQYFRALSQALQTAQVYGKVVVVDLGAMHRPDLPAELADVLIRLDNARAVLCCGVHGNTLYFSLRTKLLGKDAGLLAQEIIDGYGKAGGHGAVAGGQVGFDRVSPDVLVETLKSRLLAILGENEVGVPLLNSAE